MVVYVFCGQCICQYVAVTVSISKPYSLWHSSECSIYTISCCSLEGYIYEAMCILGDKLVYYPAYPLQYLWSLRFIRKKTMLDDEAKPKKSACSGRLPSSITEA